MSGKGQADETLDPAPVKWNDEDIEESKHDLNKGDDSVDENGFLARSKRRISEHPKISQIMLARQTSKHEIIFFRKALTIIASSTIVKILFLLLRLIPVLKIIIVVIYYSECPAEKMIPIYLLVGGITSVLRDIVAFLGKLYFSADCLVDWELSLTLFALIYTLAEFAWFITGSVYVFKTYNHYQGTNSEMPMYCNNVLYIFSFVVTIISYFLLFVVITISLGAMCLARFATPPREHRRKPGGGVNTLTVNESHETNFS